MSKGKPMLATVVLILKIAVPAYLLLAIAAYAAQRVIIFPGRRGLRETPADMGWAFDEARLEVEGETTHGWFVPAENPRATVHFSHGNAGNISNRLETIRIFRELGCNVFIYDYGGYGLSTGKPSEQRCYADARAGWRYLTGERQIPSEQIVLFGRSLGGGVAAQLATEVAPRGVILESTFLSTIDVGRGSFPYSILPLGLFVHHRFETKDKIGKISAPQLIIHSPEDDIIPYAHGQKLFALANEPKTFLEIRGDHNEGYVESELLYVEGLRRFMEGLEESSPNQP